MAEKQSFLNIGHLLGLANPQKKSRPRPFRGTDDSTWPASLHIIPHPVCIQGHIPSGGASITEYYYVYRLPT